MLLKDRTITQSFRAYDDLHLIVRRVGLRIKAQTQQYSGGKTDVT